jgi:hypothetical protein
MATTEAGSTEADAAYPKTESGDLNNKEGEPSAGLTM